MFNFSLIKLAIGWCCLVAAVTPIAVAAPAAEFYSPTRTAEAYSQALPALRDTVSRQRFEEGRQLFRQLWTIADNAQTQFSGLGPLYNRQSCLACHPGNGRGFAPDGPTESMKTMLVRLSVPAPQGAPQPHPAYGEQLNEFGIPGVAGEGLAHVSYHPLTVSLADGETVTLRQPSLHFSELAYGPLDTALTSARIAPAVFGLGLLEAVPESEILRQAARRKPAGISGKPNWVWEIAQQKWVIGRFGWKANAPHLRQQIASAFHGDLGITSSLFKQPPCAEPQTACLAKAHSSEPELTDTQLEAIQFYLSALAVPSPAPATPALQRGASLFRQAQCIACHTDDLRTGPLPGITARAGQTLPAYTDLLFHDMGAGLADHRPDFAANGRKWRTPPLWGIGLAKQVHPRAGFLHDGRANTLQEAILWHDGEASTARKRFEALSKEERHLLLLFLASL
jgi:CxxC motif-containing protein (DUF1111 family)